MGRPRKIIVQAFCKYYRDNEKFVDMVTRMTEECVQLSHVLQTEFPTIP